MRTPFRTGLLNGREVNLSSAYVQQEGEFLPFMMMNVLRLDLKKVNIQRSTIQVKETARNLSAKALRKRELMAPQKILGN